jgi:hypothetical protein
MIIRTRKYKLEQGEYIKLAMLNVLREQWWVGLIFLAICAMYFVLPSIWWIIGAVIALILYLLFWLVQFAGVTQMEQSKILFDRLSYEITSQQIMIKLNPKQGMPMPWAQVKKAQVKKDAFVLIISKAQLIHLPYKIFNSDNERKFLQTILRKKGLTKVEK